MMSIGFSKRKMTPKFEEKMEVDDG